MQLEDIIVPKKDKMSIIMFLDQTFGTLRLIRQGSSISLGGIDLAPGTADALAHLKEAGTRITLVTLEPLSQQAQQVLNQFLPSIENIIPFERDITNTLSTCAKQLSVDLKQTIFVAADRMWRGAATEQGCLAVSHPTIAALVARGCSLQFAYATGDREQFNRISEVIPYFWERNENGSWSLLAVMSHAAVAEAVGRRIRVEILPLDISKEDPLLVQLDEINERAKEELKKQKILFADGRRMLVALGPSIFNDSLAIHGWHFQFLMPSPELLQPATNTSIAIREAQVAFGKWPLDKVKVGRIQIDPDILDIILNRCPSTAISFQADIDRYRGASNLDSSGPIISRHIRHSDNQRTVQAIVNELNEMGYCAYTHSFTHAGMTLNNVIADLPGTGYFRLDPNIRERVKEIFLKHPFPDPPDPWIKSISKLVGMKWFKDQNFNRLSPLKLRSTLETMFELKPWFPWWLKRCPLAGLGSQIIIVGCHLDSTAARDVGYNPLTDPAPGADDDASGIVATLAIARYLSGFRGKLTHSVRFCFFNAEDSGLVGSKAYAAMLKASGAPIKAVVCMDMIGYNSDAARIFEIHAGYTDPAVRDNSAPIADSIATWASCLGALAPAQIYKGTSSASGADRNLYDGAINRSDHAAFHQQGYPAVVVSEDFFVNLASEPGVDPNPNYHRGDDTVIDSAYASNITCAVSFAIKELARG